MSEKEHGEVKRLTTALAAAVHLIDHFLKCPKCQLALPAGGIGLCRDANIQYKKLKEGLILLRNLKGEP